MLALIRSPYSRRTTTTTAAAAAAENEDSQVPVPAATTSEASEPGPPEIHVQKLENFPSPVDFKRQLFL